jgi:hypothetical protein
LALLHLLMYNLLFKYITDFAKVKQCINSEL